MKVVCLIPARGGSKRIPNKNLMLLNGKPLIQHAVEKANKCRLIDEVYVSTEDDTIGRIASKSNAMHFIRPKELSGDKTTTEEVMLHFASSFIDFDYIVLFECTFPLTTVDDIYHLVCMSKVRGGLHDSVLSLKRTKDFIWSNNHGGSVQPDSYPIGCSPRTQDFSGILIESGGLYITSYDKLMKSKARVSEPIGFFELDHPSIEIDTMDDFKMVEALMNGK